MNKSPYGLSCELPTRMAVVDNPITVSNLGEGCLVEARKNGDLPDLYAGTVRKLGQECITHCLASRLASGQQN